MIPSYGCLNQPNCTTFSSKNFIGFDSQELREICDGELLNLRASVLEYLNCRKLKNRNSEFLNLYYRILKELKSRNIFIQMQLPPAIMKAKEGQDSTKLLGKKFKFSSSLYDIDFPNFLNDSPEQNHKKCYFPRFEECFLKRKKSLATNLFNQGLFNEKFDYDLNDLDLSQYHIQRTCYKPLKFEKEKQLSSTMFNLKNEDSFFFCELSI